MNGYRMNELNLVGTKSMTKQNKCRAYSLSEVLVKLLALSLSLSLSNGV